LYDKNEEFCYQNENFTLEWGEKFEGSVSFGKARGERELRGFLELCNYKIPSMILFLIASQDYILIPYQKDGKVGTCGYKRENSYSTRIRCGWGIKVI